jgi:hypothetical protein
MRTSALFALAGFALYYATGAALVGPTNANLREACRPTLDDRQSFMAPIVWPITYGFSTQLRSEC